MFSPIKFFGLTVLSFNTQLGVGSAESTLSVDLIQDCEAGDVPSADAVVGAPAYFRAGVFSFGGVIASWTKTQGGSGQTYNIKISDPRQLLENFTVVVDSYLGQPISSANYFNAYAYYESTVLNANCNVFGTSFSGERGMPYPKVLQALNNYRPTLYSPTGYPYTVNWGSFPGGLPTWYRVAGPSFTLLQLLQEVCDVTGFDFYVSLSLGNIINIGLIDLKQPVTSFGSIVSAYDGKATDLSYGQELRNDITKTVLFGEKQHYLSQIDKFNHFFGEDNYNGTLIPVIPYGYDNCGFWISKKVEALNLSLRNTLPGNGPFTLHELDIRCAMASEELWQKRAMSPSIPGTFNAAVRATFPTAVTDSTNVLGAITQAGLGIDATAGVSAGHIPVTDALNQGNQQDVNRNKSIIQDDLSKVWNFVKSLGETYYGKQFLSPLNQYVCWYRNNDNSELNFTDVPTNAGGWIDPGYGVLNVYEPELSLFKTDDSRVGCFAIFNTGGDVPASDQLDSGDANSPEITNMTDVNVVPDSTNTLADVQYGQV